MIIAARRSVSDSSTWEVPFDLPGLWRDTLLKTRIIHRLHRFFKEGLLNFCDLRVVSCSQPAPDRVDHDDNSGKHYDSGETRIDETLKGALGFLRQRPEDVGDGFEPGNERGRAHKR